MKKIIIVSTLMFVAATANAGELTQFKNKDIRSNHAFIYEDGCQSCHASFKEITDASCVDCHGEVADIEISTELVFDEANPHTSLHYGNGVSCLACHSEHKTSAPLCADCHKTWFKQR